MIFKKHNKFVTKIWKKGVISEKNKSISAGLQYVLVLLDRSGHDRSQSFGPILHVSDSKMNC